METKFALTEEGFSQLKRGHPWLRSIHFKKSFKLPKIPCVYPLGEHWFLVSPQSQISFRRLGPLQAFWPDESVVREIAVTNEGFEKRFSASLIDQFSNRYEMKKRLVAGDNCFRWLFSENDGIPGLVVDCIEDDIVVQIGTAPIEYFWPSLKKILESSLRKTGCGNFIIHECRDMPSRMHEGLEISQLNIQEKVVVWNGLKWHVRPGSSQKTGLYLDQRQNHSKAAALASKLNVKTALDLFCYEAGFGMHLAKAGVQVTGVDSSQEALDRASKNATLNGLKDKIDFYQEDVFQYLQNREEKSDKIDMIILDPPAFAKRSSDKDAALQGLRELLTKSLKILKPGGLLVLFSCSHHVSLKDMKLVLAQVSHRTRQTISILEETGPSGDHMRDVLFPEGEYLKALWVLVS